MIASLESETPQNAKRGTETRIPFEVDSRISNEKRTWHHFSCGARICTSSRPFYSSSDSDLTPLSSSFSTHCEPRHCSHSGDGSTVPVATRSSRFPCSSASSSNAVSDWPANSVTSAPERSVQVGPCDRHSTSPKRPLKSARTHCDLGVRRLPLLECITGFTRWDSINAQPCRRTPAPSQIQMLGWRKTIANTLPKPS